MKYVFVMIVSLMLSSCAKYAWVDDGSGALPAAQAQCKQAARDNLKYYPTSGFSAANGMRTGADYYDLERREVDQCLAAKGFGMTRVN